jgi:hypothetical protein
LQFSSVDSSISAEASALSNVIADDEDDDIDFSLTHYTDNSNSSVFTFAADVSSQPFQFNQEAVSAPRGAGRGSHMTLPSWATGNDF